LDRALSFNYDLTLWNFTPDAEQAFHYAMGLISPYLQSSEIIRIQAIYGLPLPGGTLGVCIPNSDMGFSSTAYDSTWYPAALSNAITGNDHQSGELDINIFIGSANWYTGTDGNCPSGSYDLVSVVLHELVHGMGFISLMGMEGAMGKYGDPDSMNFQYTTFPMPDFGYLPAVYDHFLYKGNEQLTDTSAFLNVSLALGQALRSDSIFFSGPQTDHVLNNQGARIYAPSTYQDGSSIHHLDENSYPAGSTYSLMTPFIGKSEVNHTLDSLSLAILYDIGWGLPGLDIQDHEESNCKVFPVPVSDKLYVQHPYAIREIRISDVHGRELIYRTLEESIFYCELDLQYLSSGSYTLSVRTTQGTETRMIVVK
jgi:hypothetical protein